MTLYTARSDLSQRPSSFVVSTLVHIAGLSLLLIGILYAPESNYRIFIERYTMRHLELHTTEPPMQRATGSEVEYPGPHPTSPPPSAPMLSPGENPTASPAGLLQIAKAVPGPQTLVQPYLHSNQTQPKEIPVPTVLIWSAEITQAQTIVAPLPVNPPTAVVQPSLDPPNEEVNLADLGVSATELAAPAQAIRPSTTAPLVVRGPELLQMAPVTTVASSEQPIAAAVMSLSDLRMTEGSVTLPPVNETASSTSPGSPAQGQTGSGNPASKTGGMGVESGDQRGQLGSRWVAGSRTKADSTPAHGADAASGSGNQSSADHITLSRDGQFGAVVVGAALEEKYPELAGLWSGRMAYTVYLHVGLARSWILQYSLPRAADAAAAGNIARLAAPWPYNIVRPKLVPGAINADALMVHGFVNQAGRFETLAIAFPPEFAQAQFVINALDQWQFRPAAQNGQITRVEVLLIIPEETE